MGAAGPPDEIHRRIFAELGSTTHFHVYSRGFPPYRFVDVYRAVDEFCKDGLVVKEVLAASPFDLIAIVRGTATDAPAQPASTLAWQVAQGIEEYLPVDRFWIGRVERPGRRSLVVRLRYNPFADAAQIEVATEIATDGQDAIEGILDLSSRQSIYRNEVLSLSFGSAPPLDGDDIEKPPRLRVEFRKLEPIADADVFIDQETRHILLRNVVDLHTRREILKANHVPMRRGILLYGPPGTGKTFACRYLCSKVTNATRLIVGGQALYHVGAIFSLARLLQPTILILEDVDLTVPARDLFPLGNAALGELLDHMDGLRSHEEIVVVLTTNAIQRMEAAVRDRPGRISQLVEFGPPSAHLREACLVHHLRHHDTTAIDIKALVSDSDGATQAFLKEWVHRTVQIACERINDPAERPSLRSEDFAAASAEMHRFADAGSGTAIGFLRRS